MITYKDEIEWLTPKFDYWSCFGYLVHFKPPLPDSEWLAMGIHQPVLKTTLNVCFQKCTIHRVVSSVRSEIQFLSCFIWHFVNPIEPETEMGLFMFGCSLFARFSVSTVGLEPSEKTTTSPSFRFRSTCNESSNINQWIYKMPNKRRQKLYFAPTLIWNINEHH